MRLSSFHIDFSLLLWIINASSATPVMDNDKVKYEEYMVEHELSATQAKNVALTTEISSMNAPPGCKECTDKEKKYCITSDLVNDHCCCDRRYHEFLPYIPHTCYFGTELCTTKARDCSEYARLRTCCCDKYLLEIWKKKFSPSNAQPKRQKTFTLLLLCLSAICIFM